MEQKKIKKRWKKGWKNIIGRPMWIFVGISYTWLFFFFFYGRRQNEREKRARLGEGRVIERKVLRE